MKRASSPNLSEYLFVDENGQLVEFFEELSQQWYCIIDGVKYYNRKDSKLVFYSNSSTDSFENDLSDAVNLH